MKTWDSDFDKRFNRMQRGVSWFIRAIVFLIVCVVIGYAVAVYKLATMANEQDWSGGIKPVIEKVWCGKPGCLEKNEG